MPLPSSIRPSPKAEPLEFKCQRRVALAFWLYPMAAASACIMFTVQFFESNQLLNLVVVLLWLIGGVMNIFRYRADRLLPFIIRTHTAGYGQKDEQHGLIAFPKVTEATETASALELRHDPYGSCYSGKPRVLIPRHQFAPDDWEQLVAILLDRIRIQAPGATIRTARHPDG